MVALGLFLPTTLSFFYIWTSKENLTYSHGLLLLAVCIYLIYLQWNDNKKSVETRYSVFGVAGTLLMSLLWFLVTLGNVQIGQQFFLIFVIIFIFIAILGIKQAKLFLYPLFILIFAMPVWDFLNIYLRTISTKAVGIMLGYTDIVSFVEGFTIFIPSGTFLVDNGCAGTGQFITALSIAYIFVFMQAMQWWLRLSLIVLAVITGLVSNFVRIFVIIVSGHLTNMEHYFVTVEHVSLGWVVFAIGIMLYLFIASKLAVRFALKAVESETDNEDARQEGDDVSQIMNHRIRLTVVSVFLILASLSAGPALAYYYQLENASALERIESVIPEFEEWKLIDTDVPGTKLEPDFRGADRHMYSSYEDVDGHIVEVNFYEYFIQHQGKEAVNDLNEVFLEEQWKLQSRMKYSPSTGPDDFELNLSKIVSRYGQEKIVWQWYEINNTWTASDIAAKLLNIRGILFHSPKVRVIIVSANVNQSEDATNALLTEFVSRMSHGLNSY